MDITITQRREYWLVEWRHEGSMHENTFDSFESASRFVESELLSGEPTSLPPQYKRVKIGSKEEQTLRTQGARHVMTNTLAGDVVYLVEEKKK